ncbi:MAG: AzlC family ABC transporter permease [Burkholderiaceae bacterium]
MAPALFATGTWGLVTGVAMVKSGLTLAQAIGMTLLAYAGSAQLAAMPLIVAGVPLWVVLIAATVVNLRFVIFSAGLYPFFRRFPLGKRLFLGYITGDVHFAIFLSRFAGSPLPERGSTHQVWFFLGMAALNWAVWQGTSILGILLGHQVPGEWGLDFAAILALIALTVPMINSRPAVAGVLASAAVAVLGAGLPLRLGLVAAVVIGIAVAMGSEIALERTTRRLGNPP